MRPGPRKHKSCVFISVLCLLLQTTLLQCAETPFTRVYALKNIEAPIVIQLLNFSVVDASKKRILSGQGKRLVVTDTEANQNAIAELLPIIDQPTTESEPRKILMEAGVRLTNYLNSRAKEREGYAPSGASAMTALSPSGPAQTYDDRKRTVAYKSVYSNEDEILNKKTRVITNDPPLPSVANLTLQGIFFINPRTPIALLSFQGTNFTARNGGLYYNNKSPLKGISTKVLKDRVIVTGPDRIPREITFKTSL